MTAAALDLAPVVLAARTGAGTHTSSPDVQLLERAARDDYDQWLSTVLEAGGCVRPIRLSGTVRDVDTATGEIVRELHTEDLPDKAIYVPCRERRESVCPPCADTYRRDTYQLIRTGLAGGKGTPESVATHPAVSPPSPLPRSGRCIRAGSCPAAGSPGAGPDGRRKSALMGGGSPAASDITKTTHCWVARCARTAMTTRQPWCGTRTPPSCGGAPSSRSGGAWARSANRTAPGLDG